MTLALVGTHPGHTWTIDDLQRIPDDGLRYEIVDGSLLVSPPPAVPHLRVTTRLRNALHFQAPTPLVVCENAGIELDGRTYRVPDLTVVAASALDGDGRCLRVTDVVLAIEVLSPGSAGDDLVLKRHQYGRAGIPHYWVVDQHRRTLTVLRHDGATGYDEVATVSPGTKWHTDAPYDLILDPGDFV